jgi:hypothetical protein
MLPSILEDQALLDMQSLPQICQTRGAGISELFVRKVLVGAVFWIQNTQPLVHNAMVAITVQTQCYHSYAWSR